MERPILFSTPMVQAILEGRKTQTRRIKGLDSINDNPNDWQFEWADFSLKLPWRFTRISSINEKSLKERTFIQEAMRCPYGKVGDVIWVRETWNYSGGECNGKYVFKTEHKDPFYRWKPSIHMPKSACRIKLEITNIRVERLKDISETDAIAEGIEKYGPFGEYKGSKHPGGGMMRYRAYGKASRAYEDLWEEINGEGSWRLNPWVWVIEFKKT